MDFWRKEFSQAEIDFIIWKIHEIRIIGGDGRISFIGGTYDYWFAVMVSAVGINFKSDALRCRTVRGVLSAPELPRNFTEKDFRGLVYRFRSKFQNEELKPYRVAFPIWNLPEFLNGRKKMGDVTLNFFPSQKSSVYQTIIRERENQQTSCLFKAFFTEERMESLQQCSICLAHIRANGHADANERASEALYEVLGLVNLAVDGGKYWRSSSRLGGKLPVSEVLIGPHTTTHFESGKLTHDGFWYEDWVGGPNRRKLDEKKTAVWERRFQGLAKGISESPWREACKSACVRYFKAFSNPNLEEAFLDGWRLFENISGSRHEKIKAQILRASNIFQDNLEYRIIGQHLAIRRNLLAHGHAIKSDDDETLAFQMLQFVVPFLERYILNGFNFSSPSEFWEFLELPAQPSERAAKQCEYERQLELLAKAAQFRGERKV